MRGLSVRKTVTAALLTALALVIFVLEARLPALAPVPGIKLGLANIVTVFTLFMLGPRTALLVLVCRVVLGGFAAGQPSAILYGLSGGLAAFVLSALLYRRFPKRQIWVLSALSAAAHNFAQLAAAALVTGEPGLFVYLPVLTVSGILAGAFTGAAAQALMVKLVRSGAMTFYWE